MKIEKITDKCKIFNGELNSTLQYLKEIKVKSDLVVFDPNYDEIDICFKEKQYENVYNLLDDTYGIMVHYTYAANGSVNCEKAKPNKLIPLLELPQSKDKKYSFFYKSTFHWQKYTPEVLELLQKKRSQYFLLFLFRIIL